MQTETYWIFEGARVAYEAMQEMLRAHYAAYECRMREAPDLRDVSDLRREAIQSAEAMTRRAAHLLSIGTAPILIMTKEEARTAGITLGN